MGFVGQEESLAGRVAFGCKGLLARLVLPFLCIYVCLMRVISDK